jgi:hypothetical protein
VVYSTARTATASEIERTVAEIEKAQERGLALPKDVTRYDAVFSIVRIVVAKMIGFELFVIKVGGSYDRKTIDIDLIEGEYHEII